MSRGLADSTITKEQLVAWGAARLYSERHLERWMGGRQALTVGAILEVDTAGGRPLWAIMREEVLPAELMHQCAIDLALWHLERVDELDTYVDFRSRRAPQAKQAWLDGELSLGGLMHVARRAADAQALVSELEDPVVHHTAQIMTVVTETEPAWTFRQIYYRHRDVFDDRDSDRAVLDMVHERIRHW